MRQEKKFQNHTAKEEITKDVFGVVSLSGKKPLKQRAKWLKWFMYASALLLLLYFAYALFNLI